MRSEPAPWTACWRRPRSSAIEKSPTDPVAEGDRVTVLKTQAMPSTYAQALCLLGGQKCLQGFAELSRHIHSKYAPPKQIQELLQRRGLELKARSTTMNYQPYCSSMAEVYDFHRERKSAFDERVRLIAEQTEGEALVPEMKGLARCESKAAFKYADETGVSYYRLTDIVRATILYDSLASMYKGLDVIHGDKDIQIIEFNDRYLNHLAGGYRDLQLSVRMHGMVAELQLNTRGMAHVKEHSGHRSFEVKRELVAMVQKGNAQKCYDILDWGRKELGDAATHELTKILNDPEKPMLHQAASGGHAELVSVLLRFAADVSLKDNRARTALHEAASGGHERVVWCLLCSKADIHVQDELHQTPLVEALLRLHTRPSSESAARLVSMMSQCMEDGVSRLATATEQLEEFIKKRRYASAELVMAAADGNVQKVEELLCNFADPNSKDATGMPPLFAVLMHCERLQKLPESQATVLKLLVDHKAQVNFSFEKRSTFDVTLASQNTCLLQFMICSGLQSAGQDLQTLLRQWQDRKANFWASEEKKVQRLCSAIAVIDWDARKRQEHYNLSKSGTPSPCTPSNILHPSAIAQAISKIDSTRFLPVQEAACKKARYIVEWSRNFQWDAEHVSFGELLAELLSLKAQLGAELPELNADRLKAWGFGALMLMRDGSLWFRSDAFFKYAMPSIFKCCHFSCAEVKQGLDLWTDCWLSWSLEVGYSLEDLLRARPHWPELIKLGKDLPELLTAAVKADSFDEVFLRSEWLNSERLELKFQGRDCGTGLATLLELLSRCTELRELELDLSGTILPAEGSRAFAKLQLPLLRSLKLELSNCQPDARVFPSALDQASLPELRSLELNLRLCGLNADLSLCGLEAVAQALSKLVKLSHLSLNWTENTLDGRTARALREAMLKMPDLESADVRLYSGCSRMTAHSESIDALKGFSRKLKSWHCDLIRDA
ncbi:XBAT32 [Symbiodinium sp. CCMP2592]|nr:XBAT32 [Symbiodinium sp. CCMP2592]